MGLGHLNSKYVNHIFNIIQDGIIIMDENRKIVTMNPSAEKMTGWKLETLVPYCSFCEERKLQPGENKCYLIEKEEVPYFLSQMPTYKNEKIDVEMSTALIFPDAHKKEYLLVLRDQSINEKEEEVRLSKQVIQMLIEAKENEHKRLAQELHDGVGQSLYSISVALQAIESYVIDPSLLSYIEEVRIELEQVINDVKSYSYQLRPKILDRLGLIAALHEMIKTLEESYQHITFSFQTNVNNISLSNTVSINLYRVIQEAVLNSIKYADATDIKVALTVTKEEIKLQMKDDGVGFDVDERSETGLGLKHMEERILQIGGVFHIEAKHGAGTTISATLPTGEDIK